MTAALRHLLAWSILTTSLAAQADWYTQVVVPKPRALHTAAYDQARNQVVVYGGNTNAGSQGDTWLWTPQNGWALAQPATSPPVLREHAMAYDPVRQRTVVYGGWDGSQVTGDTWLWDGVTWTLATPPQSPGPRMAEMAFDTNLGGVLLFGGQDAAGARLNDTWVWNGTTWTQLAPMQAPPARFDHAMATDWTRGQVVMFGGWDNGFRGDTWIWNGASWAQGPAAGPSARSEHKMALAGADVVLFAGESSAGRQQDTWSWNGTAWTQLSPSPVPGPREEHVMVEVPSIGGLLMYGGWHSTTGHLADTWTFAGGQWTALTPSAPYGTGTAASAYDPNSGVALMYGGYQDNAITNMTWSLQNDVWTLLTPTVSPPARAEPAMAYDRVRGEFVMFGGANGTTYYNDTWTFRNGAWQQRTLSVNPPARWGHVMVFDETRGTTILFSGRLGGAGTNLTDTWEWNGTGWQQLAPATSPPGREDAALVYDAGRGEPVLFGGWVGGTGFANDAWAFRLGNWVPIQTNNLPSARSEHVMAYDRLRGCIVMFGGEDASGRVNDTWELTTDWRQRTPVHAPLRREEGVMVFDERQGEIVMAVGWDLGHYNDTWHFAVRPPATVTAYGAGCRGSAAATPALTAGLPWLGETATFTASGLPAGAGAVLLFGFTRANVALDPIGMTGCVLATSPIASAPMATSGTGATLPFALPATPALVGALLDGQAAVLAPGANSLGLLSSNGVELATALK